MVGPGVRPEHPVTMLKKTIQYVSLAIEPNGKSLCVEATHNNIFLKIAEEDLSPSSIIAEAARKIGLAQEQIVLLDSKFLRVDESQTGMINIHEQADTECI